MASDYSVPAFWPDDYEVPDYWPDGPGFRASGASTSAGSATFFIAEGLQASGASSSAGTARLRRFGAGLALVSQVGAFVDMESEPPALVTQAGLLLEAERTPPVRVTQTGGLIDAERIPPVRVTQAGALVDLNATPPVRVTQAGLLLEARYHAPESTYNCWEFHVYDRIGHYLCYFDNAFGTAYLEQLNDCGGGAFTLPANDVKATTTNLRTGNVVRPRYRNVEIGAFTIDDVEEVLVAEGEGEAQLLKISGRGLIGTLDKGLVYPGDLNDLSTAERQFSSEAKAQIWTTLWNEFLTRGGGELNMGFTDAEDSAGLPWADTISINFRAGQTLLDVLRQLTGLGMDVVVDPDRTMLAYQTLGRDLSGSVVFRKGHNVLASTKKVLGADLANAVLGAGQDVLVESTDPTSAGLYGRKEVYLPVQNTGDGTVVAAANSLLLADYKDPRTAITLEVTARELFPFFDYDIGDTVQVDIPAEDGVTKEIAGNYRIYSISIREGEGPCDLRVTLELNSLEAEYLIKLQKALRASLLSVPPSSGSAASLASSTTATPASSDGSNLGPDSVDSVNIDWGTGTGQVSAADVPVLDAGTYFATDNVEAALQELGSDVTALQGSVGGIITDHGDLDGLDHDDHTQYLLADGTRAGANAGGAQQFLGGLRVGGSTDYFYVDNGGNLSLNGAATQWEDLRIEPVARTTGQNAPTFEKWYDDSGGTSRGVYLYSFDDVAVALEKEIFFTMQMPHAWKGSAIYLHVHWVGNANDTTSVPLWGLEYCWAEIGADYSDTVIVYTDGWNYDANGQTANITAGRHYISKFAAITPSASQNGLSSILIGRLFRNSSSGSDTYDASGNKCGLLYIDAHYEVDSLGSASEYVK